MADVRLICVQEDVALAEALADAFDAAGYSIDETPSDPALAAAGAGVLLWSQKAIKTPAFRSAAQGAINSGKAVIANFTGAALPPVVRASPVIDLAGWDGDPDDPRLDPLSAAVENLVTSAPIETAPAPEPPQRQELTYVDEGPETQPEAEETAEAAPDLSHIRVTMPASRSRALAIMAAVVVVLGAGLAAAGYYGRNLVLPSLPRFTSAPAPRPSNVVEIAPETPIAPPQSLPTQPIDTLSPTQDTALATPASTETTTAPPPPPPVHHARPRRHVTPTHTRPRPRPTHTQHPQSGQTPPPVTSWDRRTPIPSPKPSSGGPP